MILAYISLTFLIVSLQFKIKSVSCHLVLSKDNHGSKLIITGDENRKGKGEGDNLVIANHGGGHKGGDSNFIMQNANNRDGDVVIDGSNIVIPGENGHIVMAGNSNHNNHNSGHESGYEHKSFSFYQNLWLSYMMKNYHMNPYYIHSSYHH